MSEHIGQKRQAEAKENIERKMDLIDEYISEDKHAELMPGGDFSSARSATFSLNWFCSWESKSLGISKTSKGSDLMKRQGELHSRVLKKLSAAMTYSDEKKKTLVKSDYRQKIKALEETIKELKSFKQGLVDQNRKLLIEVESLNNQLQIERAQWADKALVRGMR